MKLRSTSILALLMLFTLTTISVSNVFAFEKKNGANIKDVLLNETNSANENSSFKVEPLILNATPTAPTCYGGNNGSINLSVSGGTTAYTYLWSNGKKTKNIANLKAGVYTVTVTDATGLTASTQATVVQGYQIIGFMSCNNVCENACNGVISLDFYPPGTSTAGWSFLWSDINHKTTQNITGLCAGTYSVTVTAANGCSTVVYGSILTNPSLTVSINNKSNPTCYQSCNGYASASVTGGTAPFTYTWSGGSHASSISNLCAGTYCVTVTDFFGCSNTACVVLTQPEPLVVTPRSTNLKCYQSCDGTAAVSVSGGTTPYTYKWNDQSGSTISNLSNLCAGTYCVTVTDKNGCSGSGCVTVTQPDPIILLSIDKTNTSCYQVCDGTASVSVNGGTTPYTYNWSVPGSSNSVSGLCAGTYSVTITDQNGCTKCHKVTITEPQLLTLIKSGVDASCYQACDGSASVTPNGGTTPYTYHWNSSAVNNNSISNLCPGTYCVTVTDQHGCKANDCIIVGGAPQPLKIEKTGKDVSCYDKCDGKASVSVSSGTSPYTYHWNSTAANTNSLTGLCAGTYCVTITDQHGCTASDCIVVSKPSQLICFVDCPRLLCYGDCNGVANLTVSGGTSPYTYKWSKDNATTKNLTGLCAGTYSVTVTDQNGCVCVHSTELTAPPALVLEKRGTNQTCYETCDGSATAIASGGTSPYSYKWNNQQGSTTSSISNLCAGTYCVTVTDANGCTKSDCVVVTRPTQLVIEKSGKNQTCYETCDGSASVVASGGTSPYTYHWNSSELNSSSLSGLCAGTYCVTVTDKNGCTKSDCIVVTKPTQLAIEKRGTNQTCYETCDGSASVVASGGTSPYTYKWNVQEGSTGSSISNLCAGTYCVTVTDKNGCTKSDCIVVTKPTQLVIEKRSTNQTCYETCDGSAIAIASGGTSPYTYKWNNQQGSTTSSISNLCAGTYCVTVTDANGCTKSDCVVVTKPTQLVIEKRGTNQTCYETCDGSATAIASGGTSPYTYKWNDQQGSTGSSISSLCAGTYCVTVTDANGCTKSDCVVVTKPTELKLMKDKKDVTCYENCDGKAIAIAMGGTSPYTYHWDNNPGTTGMLTGLCAGTYCVTVTDAQGCTKSGCVVVGTPTPLVVETRGTNQTCYETCDGSATAIASGGTSPYTYKWNNQQGSTTSSISNLCAGTYCVTVTDKNGCTKSDCVVVTKPTQLVIEKRGTNQTCYETCDGSAGVSASGGTSPYTYKWNDQQGSTGSSISNVCAGTYCVTVTDQNGCTKSDCVVVTKPTQLQITKDKKDVTCYDRCDGKAIVMASGGTSPYTYKWNNNPGTTGMLTGLCAGTYCVTITDQHGCTASDCIVVSKPSQLICFVDCPRLLCYGDCNGVANLTVSGGTSPYTYKWSKDNATTKNLTGLCAGTYSVTVTDQNGCVCVHSTELTAPPALVLEKRGTNQTCYETCDGSATAIASGGTSPYSYKWNNQQGSTTSSISNLCAGTYCVTVTDANGCTKSDCVVVTRPTQLVIEKSGKNQTCYETCDGSASVVASGGTSPYTYHWNSSELNSSSLSGLCAGTYCVTVTDKNGCTKSDCIVVTKPTQLAIEKRGTNQTCYETCDGSASVVASGGTSPYTYKWNVQEGSTGSSISNLCAGTYCVTVTDKNGCTKSDCIVVTKPTQLVIEKRSTNQTCYETCDGSAIAIASGGTSPYTYKWNNQQGSTTSSISNLCAGTYCVTVTDANGCTKSDCVVVTKPTQLVIEKRGTNQTCYETCDGSATAIASGGTSPYTYKWNDQQGSTGSSISSLCAGTYCVTVTDANGCTKSDCVVVTKPTELKLMKDKKDVTCYENCDGKAIAIAMGGTSPYTYHWDNNPGTTGMLTGLCAGTYCVTVTDAQGCTKSGCVVVGTPTPLVVETRGTNQTCYETCDGSATAIASGGTSPYTYKWNNQQGSTTSSISNLCAGTYCVTVTDKNGCTKSDCVVVGLPEQLKLEKSGTDVTCNGFCDGTASVSVSGGTSPYTYHWNYNNEDGESIDELCPGTYCVTVTDQNGCTISDCVVINEPPSLIIIQQCLHNHCAGECIGSIPTQVSGGTAPYTFLWSDGQTTQNATGLCDGTYAVTVTDQNGCSQTAFMPIHTTLPMQIGMSKTDATCHNACDGTATVTATAPPADQYGHQGGIGPYTYIWDNGETDATISGLCPGTYCVTVTDFFGCTASACIEINEPPGLIIIPNCYCENNHCAGQCEGKIYIDVFGGAEPYTFYWSNGATTQNVTGLCDGPYFLTVTDANGCTEMMFMPIQSDEPMMLSTLSTDASNCSGINCDGAINLTVAGGMPPYTYVWSNGETTEDVSGLCVGRYYVTVTDFFGCTSSTNDTVKCGVNPPPCVITLNGVPNNISCYGQCNGNIDLTVTANGAASWTLVWSNNATTEDISGLCVGTYGVTVTGVGLDGGICTQEANFAIGEPTPPDAGPDETICLGGQVQLHASGGSVYHWLPEEGLDNPSIANPIASPTVTTTYTVSISNPSGELVTNGDFSSGNTGFSTDYLFVNTPYVGDYGSGTGLWPEGKYAVGTDPNFYHPHFIGEDHTTGTGNLMIVNGAVDAGKVVWAQSVNVLQNTDYYFSAWINTLVERAPAELQFSINGSLIGPVLVAPSNWHTWSQFYTVWNSGSNTTADIKIVNANTIASGNDFGLDDISFSQVCTATDEVVVNVNEVKIELGSTDCTDNRCDGTASVTSVSGGVSPYTYKWSKEAQTTSSISNLCAGTYCVTVTDANGCSTSDCLTITCSPPPPSCNVSISGVVKNNKCNGKCVGSIDITVNGFESPTYTWSNGAATQDISGLCAGTYGVTVTEGNCSTSAVYTVTENPAIEVAVSISHNNGNNNCVSNCNGSASVSSLSGGTSPYTYHWSNGGSTSSITGLCAGTYCVTVYDSYGCSNSTCGVVNCNPDCGGFKTITMGGWHSPNNGSGNPGTYMYANFATAFPSGITVGCTKTYKFTTPNAITNFLPCGGPSGPIAASEVNPPCYGNTLSGQVVALAITLGFDNAIPSFAPSLSNLKDQFIATGTFAGKTVQFVFDEANKVLGGCASIYTSNQLNEAVSKINENFDNGTVDLDYLNCIPPPPPPCTLTINTTSTNCTSSANCGSGCNGTASVTTTGGTSPFTYKWSNGKTTKSINSLCGGQFCVTVTDKKGCVQTSCVYVTCQPIVCKLKVVATPCDLTCNGAKNGKVTLSVSYGTAPYTYKWSNGSANKDLVSLSGGTYKVTVTDKTGCSAIATAVVKEPSAITINTTVAHCSSRSCYSGCNGKITLSVSGGTSPYKYKWSNGKTTSTVSKLCGGNYCVTVTDKKGCCVVKCITVNCYSARMDEDGEDITVPEISLTDGVNLNAYPNPFTTQVNFEFTSSVDTHGKLEVYNVVGVKIAEIYNGEITADQKYSFLFQTSDLATGMYTCRLVTSEGVYTKNIVRLK